MNHSSPGPTRWLPLFVMLLIPVLSSAGVIDDALNLPDMEGIKEAVDNGDITVSFEDLGDPGPLAQEDGPDLKLNSRYLKEGDDPGRIAQHIVHEYYHWYLSHSGNYKENEVIVRKKEAEFWRKYKSTHGGGPSDPNQRRDCDANEKAMFNGTWPRSQAEILKTLRTTYKYADNPNGNQESHCSQEVSCPTASTCNLQQLSCESVLHLVTTQTIVPSQATASIQLDAPDANNISRFSVTQYDALAPGVEFPGFGSTGRNHVFLDPARGSYGYIDRSTNQVVVYLYSQIENSLFRGSTVIKVTTHGQGTYLPASQEIVLTTIAVDDVPLPAPGVFPGMTLWGGAILVALMAGATGLLAVRKRQAAIG